MSATAVVVVPPELEPGFRLAGMTVVAALSAAEAKAAVERFCAERTEGVIAIHEPFLEELPPEDVARFERSLRPVVVALPAGLHPPEGDARRARIADMLTRAVGYQVTFGGREGP